MVSTELKRKGRRETFPTGFERRRVVGIYLGQLGVVFALCPSAALWVCGSNSE